MNYPKKLPYDIYDEQVSKDYVKGYALIVFCDSTERMMLDISRFVWDKKVNTYAFIPTDYVSSSDIPCGVCYVIFNSEFEFTLAKRYTKSRSHYYLYTKEPPVNPVWFHKGWIREEYDPTKYDTGAKKYKFIAENGATSFFSKEQREEWRTDYCMQLPCYKPKSDTDSSCANSYKLDTVNDKVCFCCSARSIKNTESGSCNT